MELSQHYPAYENITIVAVTNNECAKLLRIDDREITELEEIRMEPLGGDQRASGTPNSAAPDFDEMKKNDRGQLYKKLSDRLQKLLKKDVKELVLCAPETNKNELTEAMHADVSAAVVEVVPKNLASLPLDAIMRILQETRT